MQKTTPHFWNLNEDSQLSGKVLHFIKPGNFLPTSLWKQFFLSFFLCFLLLLVNENCEQAISEFPSVVLLKLI